MAKTPVKLTEEELKEMIQLEAGSKSAEISEGVFHKLFEDKFSDEKIKFDGKISKLIYGGIIATVLLIVAIFASMWLFMGSYQQNYFETQSEFQKQFNDLHKENSDLQLMLMNDLEGIKEKQNYFERLLDRVK